MDEVKINKYTIDFTEDDKIALYKRQIVDWWIDDAHPEIVVRAEKVSRELIQQEKEVEHSGD